MFLNVSELTFKYGESASPLLNSLSFQMELGEIVILCGCSGCGKSTLARVLANLEHNGERSGKILYDDKDVSEMDLQERMSYVMIDFQVPSSFCMKTLREEFQFILHNLEVEEEEMDQRITDMVHELHLSGLIDRSLLDISEGEKQLAALACVLIARPKLCILDEPFAHMDDDMADKLLVYLHKLRRKEQISFLVIDHIIERWLDISDAVMIMNSKGELPIKYVGRHNLDLYEDLLSEEGIIVPYKHPKRYYHERSEEILMKLHNFTLYHKRNGDELVSHVDLEIPRGAIIGIYGRSGVGKTTFLEALANGSGFSGDVSIDDVNIKDMSVSERNGALSYIVQNIEDVFIHERVFDEFVDALMSFKPKTKVEEVAKEAKHLLTLWNLDSYLRFDPYDLSVGKGRLLLIAMSLLTPHKIICLDEPTYGQDKNSLEFIMKTLQTLSKQGVSVIFVTHNKDVAREYADIMYEMVGGRMVEIR